LGAKTTRHQYESELPCDGLTFVFGRPKIPLLSGDEQVVDK
jgi:hypothetical protein